VKISRNFSNLAKQYSQNCDGLHVRSGLNRNKLSELHGNCFIEFCSDCDHQYLRLFDVTEMTAFRKHSTGRFCTNCDKEGQLRDSIIHFGEKLRNGSPYNWQEASCAVKQCDLIVCLGSSLKVLKHYPCLWPSNNNNNNKKTKYQLFIVSIQWTPKDKQSNVKINGYCDQVMKIVMDEIEKNNNNLNIKQYSRLNDPIIKLAIDDDENSSKSRSSNIYNTQKRC
jgi:NAD+-dependent protein deacetylase sirtuin 7